MSPAEREWFDQFARMLDGEPNRLSLRVPPRIRAALESVLRTDDYIRQFDAQRPRLSARFMGLLRRP